MRVMQSVSQREMLEMNSSLRGISNLDPKFQEETRNQMETRDKTYQQ
jgi:hypothetical protein